MDCVLNVCLYMAKMQVFAVLVSFSCVCDPDLLSSLSTSRVGFLPVSVGCTVHCVGRYVWASGKR